MDKPKIENAKSSGEPRYNMIGRKTGMLIPSSIAPKIPPKRDAVYAAPSARPAWPCLAKG